MRSGRNSSLESLSRKVRIVMSYSKTRVLCLSFFLMFFVTACTSSLNEEAEVQDLPAAENGISLKTEFSEYPTDVKEIIVKIINESDEIFTTGVHVFLEKKVGNTWYRVPMKADSFTDQGILHSAHETSSLSLNVGDLNYNLTSGEYRATLGGMGAPFKITD